MFYLGFIKRAQKEVAKAGIFYKGRYLMGVRQDNGKWTEPGGHLEKGEDPLTGVVREVKEETGLSLPPSAFKPLGSKEVPGKDLTVHTFRADLDTEPKLDVSKDPDHEVFGWNWVPVKKGKLPASVSNNLHVPAKHNALHFYLGFEKKSFIRKLIRVRPSSKTKSFLSDIPGQTAQSMLSESKHPNKERDS